MNDPMLKPVSAQLFRALAATVSFALAVSPATARPEPAASEQPLVIPLKVIGGKLIAIGYVTGAAPERTKSAVSYEIALDKPETVVFSDSNYGYLVGFNGAQLMESGEALFIDISFKPNVTIPIPARNVTPAPQGTGKGFDKFSILYETQLEGHPLMGYLGTGFLSKYHSVIDVPNGRLTLYPSTVQAPHSSAVPIPFTVTNGQMRIPVRYGEGQGTQEWEMVLGHDYDTLIDGVTASALGKPAGDVKPVRLNGPDDAAAVDLSDFVAFRPTRSFGVNGAVRGKTVLTLGVNLLESFILDVDWANSQVLFTPAREPEYPQADLEFFKVQTAANADEMQRFLEHHRGFRLAADGAAQLTNLRLDTRESSDEQIMAALKWVADTASFANRAMEMLKPYVDRIREAPERSVDLAIKAGEFALTFSRGSMNIQEAYRLHYGLGEDYLKQGRNRDAWRHLLTAASQPLETGMMVADEGHNICVQALLGKVYEEQGRLVRAYSRYRQAYQLLEPRITMLDSTSELDLQLIKEQLGPEGWPNFLKNFRTMQAIRPQIEAGLARLEPKISAEAKEMLDAK